jgi:hypothetical protein
MLTGLRVGRPDCPVCKEREARESGTQAQARLVLEQVCAIEQALGLPVCPPPEWSSKDPLGLALLVDRLRSVGRVVGVGLQSAQGLQPPLQELAEILNEMRLNLEVR